MKRVWKPLDVGGFRLYKVERRFLNYPKRNGMVIVAADSPSHAARLYEKCFEGVTWKEEEEPIISGHALNILMPADWWDSGAPDAYCEKCHKWTMRVVNYNLVCVVNEAHTLSLKEQTK